MPVTISDVSWSPLADVHRASIAGVLLTAACVFGGAACQGDDTSNANTGNAIGTSPDASMEAGSSPSDETDGGAEDDSASDASSLPDDATGTSGDGETISCTPGEVVRCSQPNTKSIEQCQEDGTGTIPSTCAGTSVCRDGECVDVFCIPGRGKCQDKQAQECNEEGTEWVDTQMCSDDQQCSKGRCIDRCDNAAQNNSYIGCEYWAVELENHLLFEESEEREIPEDRTPPFAVVLANTQNYDAEVTIWRSPGKYAEAVGSRTVGTDVRRPNVTLQTVHSELVDQEGNRLIDEPIDGPIKNVPLPSNSLLTLILPHQEIPDGETTLKDVAYKVETSQPAVAYQFNPYCCNYNYTNDASLLLPKSALTGNYRYMSAPVWNHPRRREGDSAESATISVVATEPDTNVTVQLREPDGDNRSYQDVIYPIQSPDRISGPDDQGRITVQMDPFEVLNIAGKGIGGGGAEDFTGATIEADKPISAFGAHSCTFIPFYQAACDHLESQLQPSETWGTRFAASPLRLRAPDRKSRSREGTYWKFVARKDGTEIETGLNLDTSAGEVLPAAGEGAPTCSEFASNPQSGTFTLDAGESCEFGTKEMFVATATQPILLGAFVSGQESVGENVDFAGDPAFFVVPPVVQYRTDYSFLTPETYKSDYVTLTVRGSETTFQLDGETIDISMFDTYEQLPNSNFSRVHIPVEPGPHQISANIDFGIVAYGYHDYVSYAYTGGLDLAKRNQIE